MGRGGADHRPGDQLSALTRARLGRALRLWAAALALARCAASDDGLPPEPDPDKIYAVPAVGHAKGPDDGLVTVIEAADFQCGSCGGAFPRVTALVETYANDLRVLFVHYPLPMHPRAIPAAVAAECAAEQGEFWRYAERLFAGQPDLSAGTLRSHASALGLDLQRWVACTETPAALERVRDHQRQMAAFGVRYTPTFFVNGRYRTGTAGLDQAVAEALQAAREAVAGGVARADYYEQVIIGTGLRP